MGGPALSANTLGKHTWSWKSWLEKMENTLRESFVSSSWVKLVSWLCLSIWSPLHIKISESIFERKRYQRIARTENCSSCMPSIAKFLRNASCRSCLVMKRSWAKTDSRIETQETCLITAKITLGYYINIALQPPLYLTAGPVQPKPTLCKMQHPKK